MPLGTHAIGDGYAWQIARPACHGHLPLGTGTHGR